MEIHSSVLARRTHGQRMLGVTVHRIPKSQTQLEQLLTFTGVSFLMDRNYHCRF